MSDYTDAPGMTRCTKNCFECPECVSPLTVSIHDEPQPVSTGKQFRFACGHCAYTYNTKIVQKPAPLSTILKNEQPSYFQDLHEKHTLAHRLLRAQDSPSRSASPKFSPDMLMKMKQMNIDPASAGKLGEIEKMEVKLADFTPQPVDIDADFVQKTAVRVPKGMHLTAKTAYTCNTCGTSLVKPVPDARSMKYLEKELAIDVMPLVTAKISCADAAPSAPGFAFGCDTPCVLNIVNPMLVSMTVTVSTLEYIPSDVSGTTYKVSLSLPITKITVPARRDKANVLDSIPSVYLTSSTQASRAELLTRAIRREGLRRNADSNEPFVEQGSNWVSLPFTVAVFEKDEDEFAQSIDKEVDQAPGDSIGPKKLRLPFYVTVESRLPSQWTTRGKKGLKYGFWVLCDV